MTGERCEDARTHVRPARRRTAFAGVLACAVLSCGACSSPPEPKFDVKSVTLIEQTEHGYVLNFTVEGENRGPEPLPLRTVSYSLSLDGREVFRGSRSAQATLRRFGSQAITLPVAVPLTPGEAMPSGRVPYRFAASVEYALPGSIAELLFDSDIRKPTAAFSEGGRLDFDSIKVGAPHAATPAPDPAPAEATPAAPAPAP